MNGKNFRSALGLRSAAIWPTLFSTLAVIVILVLCASVVNWEFVGTLDFGALWVYRYALWQGLLNTLTITGISVSLGMVIGILLAAGSQQKSRILRWSIIAYVEIFRNTPLVVQLFWFHFAVPIFTGINTTPFETGFIVITVQSSAYLSDVARAGINGVPKGQWEAADALGLSAKSKWLDIILPQALRLVIPPLANIGVGYFKASAVLALLSVGELTTVASSIARHSLKPIETYTTVGIIYLILGYILSSMAFRVEKIFERKDP